MSQFGIHPLLKLEHILYGTSSINLHLCLYIELTCDVLVSFYSLSDYCRQITLTIKAVVVI